MAPARVVVLALLALTGALAASTGCSGSRFPGCKTNAECTSDDEVKPGVKKHSVCFDYRCVECHYDGDCPDGTMCSRLNECASLNSTTPASSASATSLVSRPPKTF